ncbi:hypothetical protein T03_15218 [Trichinella britovi]|uniref:Uncharacterized protein n=1 Tax=Trichinella britovi TaxID=45882 RepID=A0A0V1A984_TRIBR|nr:hypothetical protein T03_15218 [Trichinella britovi]
MASAPSTQLLGAFEARNLPLFCLGPLYNIALYVFRFPGHFNI